MQEAGGVQSLEQNINNMPEVSVGAPVFIMSNYNLSGGFSRLKIGLKCGHIVIVLFGGSGREI